MLPGKTLTPEDVLRILRRRIWLILLPLAVVSAATAVVARKLPDRFRSETLILVVPGVPESYVKSSVTTSIEERLQTIAQQILSRTRLERIIQDFDLYNVQRRTEVMEKIVERMRKDIDVEVARGDSFRVAYVGDNASTVMRVTDRLASLFIEENLRDREAQAESTNDFLEIQLEESRRRLIEHEKKLEEYRKRFPGELPSQLASNLQIIQNIQMQVQTLVESINRDRDRRLLIERQLRDAEHEIEAESPALQIATPRADVVDAASSVGTVSQQLAAARAALTAMERRLKPEHPEVQRMRRVISDLATRLESESRDSEVSAHAHAAPIPTSRIEIGRRGHVAELRDELSQLDRQLASKDAEDKRLRSLADRYQQRVDKVPTRESELAELTRDYSTLQTMYTTLLSKQEDSKIAANFERRQIGAQFKLLDPARMAEAPFSPNRRGIILIGMTSGLVLGLGLIALLEYRDRSFKNDNELVSALALPVLAVVPWMESDNERRVAFRRRLGVGCGLGSIVAACLCIAAYLFLG
jgi:polysaccharide chain length determinant protein (PEP-CTERM system associated)